MKLAPTYKVDLNGSIRMHVVEVEGNKYRTESGFILCSRKERGLGELIQPF